MKIYNKLVRDKIPEIIEASGKKCTYRVIEDNTEFMALLKDKQNEESEELVLAFVSGNKENMVEEIADLFELLETSLNETLKTLDISKEEYLRVKEKKKAERGGFEKRIFLESVEE